MKYFFNKHFQLFVFLSVIFCFLPLFYFSSKYILNMWAFSDGLINYSEGFVRRGLLGELILIFNKVTSLSISKIHSYIFVFVMLLNIYLFYLILKKNIKNKFIFIFIFFNPALIFFPLYDTGGYLRKELLSISLMLAHTYLCCKFYRSELDKKKYLLFLYLLIIPMIILLSLIHDIQFFLIPFHFFLSLGLICKQFKFFKLQSYRSNEFLPIYGYLLTLIPLVFFYYFPTDVEKLKIMYEKLLILNPSIWWEPIYHTQDPFFQAVKNETIFMFTPDKQGTYQTLLNYFILIIFSIFPIIIIFKYYLKIINNNINYLFLFFSILPIFLLFFIGRDWGRWLSVLAWVVVLFFFQFKYEDYNFVFNLKNKIYNILFCTVCIIFLFFFRIPHCCKGQTIFGGFVENVFLFNDVIINKSNHIKKTFTPF